MINSIKILEEVKAEIKADLKFYDVTSDIMISRIDNLIMNVIDKKINILKYGEMIEIILESISVAELVELLQNNYEEGLTKAFFYGII